MKDKNRFSKLLKRLMNVAKVKNYTVASKLQYDESYISKWVTGALLPAEKTSEKVFMDLAQCIVNALDDEGREILYVDYQVDCDSDLEAAIYDNLKVEFDYVMNLKESTGLDVVQGTVFYPELTLAQFLKKMRHPTLRQVKTLNVIMAADILALDRHYQLALAELEHNAHINVVQRSYPGVRFSMLINLDSAEQNNTYNVRFIQSLLSNLANVDFQLYASSRARGKIIFAVKDAYAISGMVIDENHCLGVTSSEEPKNYNAIYDRLRSMCNQESLLVRRVSLSQMLRSNEYMSFIFLRNKRWILNHVTEHFLSDEIFEEIVDEYCHKHKDIDRVKLVQMHKFSVSVLEGMKIQLILNGNGIADFAVNGIMDFWGMKIQLSAWQRMKCLEYVADFGEKNPNMEFRVLKNSSVVEMGNLPIPTLFLSDSVCYMRIVCNGIYNNMSVLNGSQICNMFRKYYDDMWCNEDCVDSEYSSAADILGYAKTLVRMQIEMEK